jgi:hypothetical protein
MYAGILLITCLQRLREDPSVRNLDLSSYLLVPSMWLFPASIYIEHIPQCNGSLGIPF